jgi:hypothetical protein
MDLASQWLDDCNKRHPGCPVFTGQLPTRVIRVGPGDAKLLLHVSADGEVAKYVSLSHCWYVQLPCEAIVHIDRDSTSRGNNNIFTTTMSNLEERKRGIQWSDLSSTFQDAIGITRRLGIDFLWIDSIYIIQDSIEDWARESAKMTKVYLNSAVTIAADGEEDEHGGCYAPFDSARQPRNTSIPVSCVNSEGIECCVYVRPSKVRSLDSGGAAHATMAKAAIDRRSRLNSRGMTFSLHTQAHFFEPRH